MRHIPFPNDKDGSHAAVLELVHKAFASGLRPRVLALLLHEASRKEWRSAFGRFDLTRPEDPKPVLVRPRGNVQLVEEKPAPEVFLERLRSALKGGPLRVGDVEVVDHAMDNPWTAEHLTSEWPDYGTDWPSTSAAPSGEVKGRLYLPEPIEADGPVPVFRNLERLVRTVSGFRAADGQGRDVCFSRYQLLVWDYRGKFERFEITGSRLRFAISPAGDPRLRVAGVVEGRTTERTVAESAPSVVDVDLGEPIVRTNISLCHGDDLVEQRTADFPMEALIHELQGEEPVTTTASPSRSKLDVTFMLDAKLRAIVERDLEELNAAVAAGLAKSALLLCGSILEALLLDVLDRNPGIASSYLRKQAAWPEDVSLADLIGIAAKIEPIAPTSASATLLGPAAAATAASVTDHRYLVHPRAEIRARIKVDSQTVELMVALLKYAVRDLSDAASLGLIEAYAQGSVK